MIGLVVRGVKEVAAAIELGTALAVCDGSYMPHARKDLGSAAWIVKCPSLRWNCQGAICTSGETDEVNAYQSEL